MKIWQYKQIDPTDSEWDAYEIIEWYGPNDDDYKYVSTHVVNESDARLMTTAPEMLDCLINAIKTQKEWVNVCNSLTEKAGVDNQEPKSWKKEVNQEILKTIEKATGKTIEEVLKDES